MENKKPKQFTGMLQHCSYFDENLSLLSVGCRVTHVSLKNVIPKENEIL